MEYPIWKLATTAGGFWVALISVVHVYIAQFAVGGGLFLLMAEYMARRSKSEALLDYCRKHSKFFLLTSMVAGAVTGVAIWFIINLTSPQGTIILIHQFVFAWATEWVFFLGEIVALLVYFYGWKRLDAKQHLTVAGIYFVFGWLSLFMVNGVIAYMLTPGEWLETGNFWDGFFNPTMWPQLWFRTVVCITLAGLWGFLTATLIRDTDARGVMVRACSALTMVGLLLTMACGVWYLRALPPEVAEMMRLASARTSVFVKAFMLMSPVVAAFGLFLGFRMPRAVGFPLALLSLFCGLIFTGSFEFARESARKPFVIRGHIYSNSVLPSQVAEINEKGMLALARWVPEDVRTITDENRIRAGEWLYQLQCASCHSINGPINDILPKTRQYSIEGMDAFLSGMGVLNKAMPPFVGVSEERKALAEYIAGELHGRKPLEPLPAYSEKDVEPALFDAENDKHVLMAWADQGLRVIPGNAKFTMGIKLPAIRARLYRRDMLPEVVSDDVKVIWELPGGNSGQMAVQEDGTFSAKGLPTEMDLSVPGPVAVLKAVDMEGNVLAETKVLVPSGTAPGCAACHGGTPGMVDDDTLENIVATHDRMSDTRLLEDFKRGKTVDCLKCHDTYGKGPRLSLSASIHGVHAVYLQNRDADACGMCHDRRERRGNHVNAEMTCVNCHGTMEDHTLALLKREAELGKANARLLVGNLKPRLAESLDEINARVPWKQQPDCLTCHVGFAAPETDTAFNTWTRDGAMLFAVRKGEVDMVQCAACHGSPHATYPAQGDRDNLAPLQFRGESGVIGADGSCTICHMETMDYPAHHPGMGLE